MDFLKVQIDRLKQQLAGLSPSQKMLSAALVVIMVMTLWWWARYAGSPEMEPLLDQALSKEELSRIDAQLTAANIDHKVTNDGKILVSPDRRLQAIAGLGYANVLPKNMASGWDETIKQLTAFDGPDRQNAVFNRAKEVSLERVISLFPGVASASVFIDPRYNRIIGSNIEPTANVTLQVKDGASNLKQLAIAAANMVSGAQSGITPGRVKVIVNGRLIKVEDSAAGGLEGGISAEGLLETQLAAETMLTQKLERHLSYIDNVRVSVAVQIAAASQSSQEEEYDQKKSVQLELETTSKTSEDVNGGANTPIEAGVVPNGGDTLANGGSSGGQGRSRTENSEQTKFATGLGRRTTTTLKKAGEPTPVGASVRVPKSHFVLVAKGGDPNAKEPDAAALDKIMADEISRIRKDVMVCTNIRGDDSITVEPYADVWQLSSRNATPAVSTSVAGVLGGHVKEIALGGLALMSLFMMSMIVRKGTPAVAPAAAAAQSSAAASSGPVVPAVLAAGEALAGEVAEGNPLLEGMELDDDSIKTQQMLSQVTQMVGENPDAAATLIKRWMNQR
jgi:flagellar M-ring protein FliF